MITYFFWFFGQLVHNGHVLVLETPLFRVCNEEKTIYCQSKFRAAAPLVVLNQALKVKDPAELGTRRVFRFAQARFLGDELCEFFRTDFAKAAKA